MSLPNLIQLVLFLVVVGVLVKPLGGYMQRCFNRDNTFLDPLLIPIEKAIYRLGGVDEKRQMNAREYSIAFLLFSFAGTLLLYGLLRFQPHFPYFDKSVFTQPITPDLAMNVAVSFATTSTWQPYSGEATVSYWTQLVGLAGQNFLAGAAGLAVGIAFIRGLAQGQQTDRLGNFWVDVVRSILWVLLPASLFGSLLLVAQGVPMNFLPYTKATTLEGTVQVIAQGPVAAIEFIKNLGTNGGGFFNANGAHPFENPNALTNFVEMLAIAVLPAALTNTFGRMVGNVRHGWVLFWAMTVLFVAGYFLTVSAEQRGNVAMIAAAHITSNVDAGQSGGNMEGKEARFGIGATALTSTVTSNCATGSTNAMPDSFTPLGGMIPLINMLLGEITFGGLGTGIYSIIMLVIIGLFVAGLMVGRTPQYLGRNLGASEMKIVMLYTLVSPAAILLLTALACDTQAGLAGLATNKGPHGFTEILFAYTSCFANNGQSFGGLNANLPFYNITTAIAMMMGRYALAIPALALAERFARQQRRPATLGTLPIDNLQFGILLLSAAIIVVGLGYLPALALGPVVEHLIQSN